MLTSIYRHIINCVQHWSKCSWPRQLALGWAKFVFTSENNVLIMGRNSSQGTSVLPIIHSAIIALCTSVRGSTHTL